MKNWKKTLIQSNSNLKDALNSLEQSGLQIVLIIDDSNRLEGVVTDGDLRKAMLGSFNLESSLSEFMNKNPITVNQSMPESDIFDLMSSKMIMQIPILNNEREVIGLRTIEELLRNNEIKENPVILMLGGLGSRLKDLTKNCPKPMLKVGDKPIIESIIDNFHAQGFRNFYFCVNYMHDVFKEYFEDGKKWDVSIKYITEPKRLGTAGALSLINDKIEKPFIVMNGDILTKTNFTRLLEHHERCEAVATMCVKQYEHQIPYGVVRTVDDKLVAIEEKPTEHYYVNAGIYVLEPAVLELIPQDDYFDMTNLFELMIDSKKKVSIHSVDDYWVDIGKVEDFKQANQDYKDIFKR